MSLLQFYMKITLKYGNTGAKKQAKVGFSWTSLFFGALVPLIRGDVRWALIHICLTVFTFGVFYFVFPFIYNKKYIHRLLEKGWVAATDDDSKALTSV